MYAKLCYVVLGYALKHVSVVSFTEGNFTFLLINANKSNIFIAEILKRMAEHCLRDMVQHLFTRLPQFVDDTRILPNMKVRFVSYDLEYIFICKI